MTGASFASWIPGSDVVVAQTGQTLAVWYNVDAPEAATLTPIKGDVVDVVREDGHTSVMVEEHGAKVAYLLDEGLIEFGTALHDNDFGRVILFLENLGDNPQAETMWENVARNAMNEKKFGIAARCYAAMGDVSYARFLKDIVEVFFEILSFILHFHFFSGFRSFCIFSYFSFVLLKASFYYQAVRILDLHSHD